MQRSEWVEALNALCDVIDTGICWNVQNDWSKVNC